MTNRCVAYEQDVAVRETRLNFYSYLGSFAHNAVISNYVFLLKSFKDNQDATNHQIISLFDRIVDPKQCDLVPMFFQVSHVIYMFLYFFCFSLYKTYSLMQLSVFVVFEKLLADSALQKEARFKDMYHFLKSRSK